MPTTTAGPLFEREQELARFGELIGAAGSGRGGLVVIEGSPGIGKTRLLGAMRERAERDGMRALHARGGDLERDLAFGVVRQLFERHLRRADPDEREVLLEGPARFSLSAVGADGDAPRAGPDRSYAVVHGLYWLTSNLAEERPLLLCVDDAHWSDSPSLRFLHYLCRRVADLPVLVAVTLRTADPEAEAELVGRLRAEPGGSVVRPRPLTSEAVARLVRGRLGDCAAPQFCEACHRATGGNPFLVGELISSLADDGIEPSAAEAEGVARLVPDAIGRHVFERLSRLPAEALRLARALAVLGEVEPELAGGLAELDPAAAAAAAEDLAKAELVQGAQTLRFAHPLLREAVESDLPAAERAGSHRRAAKLLADAGAPSQRVAAQLVASDPGGETWALEALSAAAREALGRGAPDSAVLFLRRALEEAPDDAGSGGLRLELAAAELLSGSAEAAVTRLEGLLDADGGGPGLATIAPLLHVARWGAGRFEAAVEIADRGVPELAAVDPGASVLLELNAALTILQGEGFAAASPRLEAIRGGEAEPVEPPRQLAGALIGLGELAPAAGPCELAEAAAARFEGVAPPLGLQPFTYLIVALHALERYETALAPIEIAIERARAMGDAATMLVALAWRAWNALYRGALDDTLADSELALAVAEDAELHMFDRIGADIRMLAAAAIDPHGELAAWADAPYERRGDATDDGVLWSRGALRLAQGRYREARDDLSEAAAGYDRMGLPGLAAADVRAPLALAHLGLGERERAAELAHESLERAERVGTPRLRGVALRCAALTGSPDGRVELLSESVGALEGSPARLDLARALCDLGEALRRGGRRRDAREHLRRARELAHACGAAVLEARAHQELLASGGRPRRIPTVGADSLTPSERRVARLAADGRSNREIAQELFVSLKTVEMHLSRSYRKLGIGSRAQLPPALRADAGGESA